MHRNTLHIAYCRSHSVAGLLIGHRAPFSRWSHCALYADDETVIESRVRGGVVETPIGEFIRRYPHPGQRTIVSHHVNDAQAGIAWARRQLGKGYDWRAVAGLALRSAWHDADRWTCSELVEMALAHAGRPRWRDDASRITPNLSYMVRP